MTSDAQLLRNYADSRSEDAFAELVRRHLNLVYSAALRRVNGDAHLAQDVTQSVFTDLARKAALLSRRPVLTGWLYTSAHFAATKAVRAESRRRSREQEAQTMNTLLTEAANSPDWPRLQSILDEAMHELREADREAILLRFFENRQHGDIGARLGVSENTARMRIERALAKLRAHLVRRGLTTTTGALSAAISANAVQLAPAGLAATVTSGSLAGAAGGTTAFTVLKIMSMSKLQIGVTALVLAGVATTLVLQRQSQAALRGENSLLRKEIGQLETDNAMLADRVGQMKRMSIPTLPAPSIQNPASTPLPEENTQATNLFARFNDKQPKLKPEQVEGYLRANGRNAASLLAAYRTTKEDALLAEAMQKYPNDPQVAFEAVFKKDVSPAERSQWLEALKKSDPGNSLPNYLSALDDFRAGQRDQAMKELIEASGKSEFRDYTVDRMQDDEEAYLAAGYSVAEAKTIPSSQLLLPQLKQVKELGLALADVAKSYRQAGDETSAQAALEMAANLGQRYGNTPGETEISWMVGMAVERIALGAMDPRSPYGNGGQTVQDRLDQLNQKKEELKALNQQLEPLLPTLSDQDWISYKDRWRAFGEESAARWVVNKYGQK
jgi:RNA polymerase sigma factor (sigma-70 family)